MTTIEARELRNGLYKVFWASGGMSLASLGITANGVRWLAPINWIQPTTMSEMWWGQIDRVERIEVPEDVACKDISNSTEEKV